MAKEKIDVCRDLDRVKIDGSTYERSVGVCLADDHG